MPTIIRNISLEPFKTRFPVCFPSINDGGGISYMWDFVTEDIPIDMQFSAHYGMIPLSINESVVSFDFTEEMQEKYNGLTIPYHTLLDWFKGFVSYFDALRSVGCREPFSSMAEYSESVYGYASETAIDADREFIEHGGNAFYEWLIDNYFTLFDVWREVNLTYEEKRDIVSNIGCERLPYPAAMELYGSMKSWFSKFDGVSDCKTTDDCCECEKYFSYGGDAMLESLGNWVTKVNCNIRSNDQLVMSNESIRNSIIPCIGLDIPLAGKMEDFGMFEIMAVDFVPGRMYKKGDLCVYDENVWVCMSEEGYEREEFIPNDGTVDLWETYFNHSGTTETQMPIISGRTVSSLGSFMIPGQTSDNMGNALPGNFTPYSGSTVVQPAENTTLDFLYMPGSVSNESILVNNGSVPENKYSGNYIESITFFAKDTYGKIIESTIRTSTITDGISTSPSDAISGTVESVESYSGSTDGKIYADFVYIKGAQYQYKNENGKVVPVGEEPYLKCTDHCTIEKKTCQYWLSENESYPVNYYMINMDVEEMVSYENQTVTEVCMCDFETVGGDTWDSHNGFMSPVFRKEDTLWFSMKEKPKDNIYIDRGYATVLDRHLRIGEVFNYEQLSKYGNGMFQIFNADEDVI